MTKLQNHAGQSQCSSENSFGTPHPDFTLKEPQRDWSPKRKRCSQLFIILGINTVHTSLHVKITKVFKWGLVSQPALISYCITIPVCCVLLLPVHLSPVSGKFRKEGAFFVSCLSSSVKNHRKTWVRRNPQGLWSPTPEWSRNNLKFLVKLCYSQQSSPMALKCLLDH